MSLFIQQVLNGIMLGSVYSLVALGFVDREAGLMVSRPAAAEAMLPGLDQTRTVGLVTLPGAFIGVLLGGGSPLQAGAAQVLVLIGIMAGQACTVALMGGIVARTRIVPDDLRGLDRYEARKNVIAIKATNAFNAGAAGVVPL